MILSTLDITQDEFTAATGWALKPEGACKGDRCVPLPDRARSLFDVIAVASSIGLALVHDDAHGLWAVGPEYGRRVLADARLPPMTLPDFSGEGHDLAAGAGRKRVIVAWASW